jgi:hypothetical protein
MKHITIKALSIPELVAVIIGEISFMQVMDSCDKLAEGLQVPKYSVDLSEMQRQCISYCVKSIVPDGINNEWDIVFDVDPFKLEEVIKGFLDPLRTEFDVVATQQNIHVKLNQL